MANPTASPFPSLNVNLAPGDDDEDVDIEPHGSIDNPNDEGDAIVVDVLARRHERRVIGCNSLTMNVQLDSLVLKVSRGANIELRGILPRNDVTSTQMHMVVVGLSSKLLEGAFATTGARLEA